MASKLLTGLIPASTVRGFAAAITCASLSTARSQALSSLLKSRLICIDQRSWARSFSQSSTPMGLSAAPQASFASAPSDLSEQQLQALEAWRAQHGFYRRKDGRVLLRSSSGAWVEVKTDGRVAGGLLLRLPDGAVDYLVSEELEQIDLSNDELVGQLFNSGLWEQMKQPLCAVDNNSQLYQVRLTPDQFRKVFTLLKAGAMSNQQAQASNT